MGVLSDDPIVDGRPVGGVGARLLAIFDNDMDDDDRARFRGWVESGMTAYELWTQIEEHYPIARSTLRHGLPKLRARWETA